MREYLNWKVLDTVVFAVMGIALHRLWWDGCGYLPVDSCWDMRYTYVTNTLLALVLPVYCTWSIWSLLHVLKFGDDEAMVFAGFVPRSVRAHAPPCPAAANHARPIPVPKIPKPQNVTSVQLDFAPCCVDCVMTSKRDQVHKRPGAVLMCAAAADDDGEQGQRDQMGLGGVVVSPRFRGDLPQHIPIATPRAPTPRTTYMV